MATERVAQATQERAPPVQAGLVAAAARSWAAVVLAVGRELAQAVSPEPAAREQPARAQPAERAAAPAARAQ